jgi:hypothetical protein
MLAEVQKPAMNRVRLRRMRQNCHVDEIWTPVNSPLKKPSLRCNRCVCWRG